MDEHEHTDLGVTEKELYGSDSMPISIPAQAGGDGKDKKVYPVLHYSGPKELHLPEEGKMEVHFCKTSETSSTRKDGSHWYSCDIEIRCIGDVESDEPKAPATSDRSAEDALDTIARKLGLERNGDDENSEY